MRMYTYTYTYIYVYIYVDFIHLSIHVWTLGERTPQHALRRDAACSESLRLRSKAGQRGHRKSS